MLRVVFILLSFVFAPLFAQESGFKVVYVNPKTGQPALIKFEQTAVSVPSPEKPELWMREKLGANASFSLKYTGTFHGKDGYAHMKYQQFYGGYKVEAGQLVMHMKGNRVHSINGKFFPRLKVDTTLAVSRYAAINKALSLHTGAVFMWELPAEEKLLKHILRNPGASYYPNPELMLISVNDSCRNSDFRLAWKLDVYAYEPHSREWIYIDAQTGEVLEREEQICSMDHVGIAHTKYSGIREITCDSISQDTFILFDRTRGNGIHTIDVRIIGKDSSREFVDHDNVWNNVNVYKDEVATDVHWGSAATYDYYKLFHNRNSYDDSDGMILSKVHVGNKYNNAYWGGQIAHYGDGDGINLSPLTSIDVVAHELTHGVTQFTAGLRYRNESGALNESFSDVFCKGVEHWVDSANFNWLIAGRITLKNDPFRDMSFPPNQGHPKYYFGNLYQKSGSFDNGGVHINSGVQNFWFYLLSEGGSGIRELDSLPFTVKPIGIQKATDIAYLNLSGSLYREAEYIDACYLSMDAAERLYGIHSEEYKQVQNAWYAVGLLSPNELSNNATQVNKGNWILYPNPGQIEVFPDNPLNFESFKAELMDISGKVLLSETLKPGEALQTAGLAAGLYFIRINHSTVLRWQKF